MAYEQRFAESSSLSLLNVFSETPVSIATVHSGRTYLKLAQQLLPPLAFYHFFDLVFDRFEIEWCRSLHGWKLDRGFR